jgi:hypothetical protein|tara:strand:+ start:2720 stop:3001 length:282 start_codon:yes stop_codon:yes gene_type:complete
MSELFPDPNRQMTLDEILLMADSKKKELEGFGLTPALRTIIECVYYASQPRLTYGVDTMMRDVEKEIANSIAFLEKENENDKASVKKLEENKT